MGALSACSDEDKPGGAAGMGGTGGAGGAGGTAMRVTLGTATRIDPGTNKYFSLEGPLWVASEMAVLFSDVVEKNGAEAGATDPKPKIHKYVPASGTFSEYAYPAPMMTSTNGLGMDSMGRLIVTERVNGRLVRVEGTMLKPLATTWPAMMGKPLNAPNDLVIGMGDNIYFSDTLWGSSHPMDLLPNSAYRVAPDGTLTKLHSDTSINGIALSPDGKTLYVGNDMAGTVVKFTLGTDGAPTSATPTPFLTKASIPGDKFSIPDGISVDDSGNVYVAMNDFNTNSIAVFDPAGTYKGEYMVPVALDPGKVAATDGPGNGPSNVTFGGADRKTMYITTHHALWTVVGTTPGKP